MEDQIKTGDLSIQEREMALKEKELELKERELRLKELMAQKGDQEAEKNSVYGGQEEFNPSSPASGGLFSLREQDNSKLFSYDGILGRKGFWFFAIPYTVILFLFLIISGAYDAFARHFTGQGAGFAFIGFILVLLFFLLAVLALFAYIKRCRDCNISLWWSVLFSFIPITGLYLFFATTKVDLSKYSKSSSDYLQSEEYLESKKTAKNVIYTILFIYLILFLMGINSGKY